MNAIRNSVVRLSTNLISSIYPAFLATVLWAAVIICPSGVLSQPTYTDTLDCSGGTPTFIVNLSSAPDAVWVSSPVVRAGQCCTPPDVDCAQFTVTLSPDAAGLIFNLPSGCGATPSGSLFFHVDCGPPMPVGSPVCLSGTG